MRKREKYICDVTLQTHSTQYHTYVRIIIHNAQTIYYCDVYMKNTPPCRHRSNFPNQDNYTANSFRFAITRRRTRYSRWKHWFLCLILIFKYYFCRVIILNDQRNTQERFEAQRINSYIFIHHFISLIIHTIFFWTFLDLPIFWR